MQTYAIYLSIVAAVVGVNLVADRRLGSRWPLWLGVGLPSLLMMWFLWGVSEPREPFGDFTKAYYPGGRLVVSDTQGMDILYETRDTMNNPIVLLLFAPVAAFPRDTSIAVYTTLGFVSIPVLWWMLGSLAGLDARRRIVLFGLFAMCGPLFNSLREGNCSHFIMFLILGQLYCIRSRRDYALGLLLGITAAIKLPFLLFGLYFLCRGRWKVVATFSLTGIVILSASALYVGLPMNIYWYQQCIAPIMKHPLAAYNVQSINGAAVRLLDPRDLLFNWEPHKVAGWIRWVLLAARLAVIGAVIAVFVRGGRPRSTAEEYLEYFAFFLMALLTSPVSWSHYYLHMLTPLAFYMGGQLPVPRGGRRPWRFGAAALLCFLPVIIPHIENPVGRALLQRVGYSHIFLGGAVFFGLLLRTRQLAGTREAITEEAPTPPLSAAA